MPSPTGYTPNGPQTPIQPVAPGHLRYCRVAMALPTGAVMHQVEHPETHPHSGFRAARFRRHAWSRVCSSFNTEAVQARPKPNRAVSSANHSLPWHIRSRRRHLRTPKGTGFFPETKNLKKTLTRLSTQAQNIHISAPCLSAARHRPPWHQPPSSFPTLPSSDSPPQGWPPPPPPPPPPAPPP